MWKRLGWSDGFDLKDSKISEIKSAAVFFKKAAAFSLKRGDVFKKRLYLLPSTKQG
jgi:hypothetical protein